MLPEQRMRPAINEFVRNVDTRLYGEIDISRSESHRSHRTGSDTTAALPLPCRHTGPPAKKTKKCGDHLRRGAP